MLESLFITKLEIVKKGDSQFAIHTNLRVQSFAKLFELISCILYILEPGGINFWYQQVIIVSLFLVQELHLLY